MIPLLTRTLFFKNLTLTLTLILGHILTPTGAPALQVLGGAGPAIAAVPLVVVWAGGSTINLVQGISRGQVGALGSASRIGFVLGMSLAQACPPT